MPEVVHEQAFWGKSGGMVGEFCYKSSKKYLPFPGKWYIIHIVGCGLRVSLLLRCKRHRTLTSKSSHNYTLSQQEEASEKGSLLAFNRKFV